MANQRFEMYEYRQVIVHMLLGESDRGIAMTGLMGRKKARGVRDLASTRSWLQVVVILAQPDHRFWQNHQN